VWVKAPAMVQEILVHSDPKRFFVPPYMGKKGWVGVRIDYKVKWDQTEAILKDGYLMSAPTKFKGKPPAKPDDSAKRSSRVARGRNARGQVR
jgi:predicted DNA-binding protein (MmcQ/YjbR family)